MPGPEHHFSCRLRWMAHVDGGLQFAQAVLHPTVTLAPGSDTAKAQRLHAKAHAECFIARSVAFPVTHQPTIVV
jgi:organic hydroperoxide reductase OsmC/OhrA